MKRIWVPVVVLLLLPASYSLQRSAGRPENVQPVYEDSIRSQTQEAGETTLYFPDYVDGGGWSVQLALSNVDPDMAAEVVVEVHGEDGESVLDLFDAGLTFEIPALGSRVLRSSGTGDIRRGWIQVRTGTNSVSGLLTYKEGTTGIEVSVEPAELGERFALFVEESDDVGAGVAVFKQEASSSIQLRVRDEEGNDPLEGAFVSRGNFHQLARTLPEWFTAEGIDRGFLSDFRGLLFLRSEDESSFAPLGLRFGKRNRSLSSVPVIRDEAGEPMETTLYFPDYVDGSGWSVQLALSNIDAETAAAVSVEVFDEEGQPVRNLFDAGSTFPIPPLGSRVLRSAGAGAIRRGWIEVESDSAAVSGLLTYRQAESGVEVSVKPVELGSQFALFVEETAAIGAGVAIFKPDAAPKVELRIRDEEGNDPLDGVFIPRGDFHQLARTLPEWLGAGGVDTGFLADFRGLLFLRSADDSQFAPLGLRFGKTNASLSSVPAIRIRDGEGIGSGQAPPPTVTLSVAPSSIDWGDSATLTWSSTNAVSAEIAPDIGTVAASGSRKVSPRATTTYRITVCGAGGRTQTASVTVRVVVSEQAALRALYEFGGGTDWTNSGNWGTGQPLGEWHGVSVDAQGRVTRLVLTGNGLTGEFPPELGALTRLETLDLRNNTLTGPIPAELGALVNLTFLVLENNNLTGSIPRQLGSLARLTTLDLRHNALTGQIPAVLGSLSNLAFLSLDGNHLSGRIPPELGGLAKLTSLGIIGNNLTGPIPPELGSLAEATFLSLRGNLLTGPIPAELRSLSKVTLLDLSDNALTGAIPPGLGLLANLEKLFLYSNFLGGSIPSKLGSLTNLKELSLANNNLTGSIPAELGSLANLESLGVNGNALTGPIPSQLGSLANLKKLFLQGNALTGPIPPELGSLAGLESLWLSSNDLTGPVPQELGSLVNLRRLMLTGNRLTGSLAKSFLRINLESFWFDSNEDLCIPGISDFVTWSKGIENYRAGAYCNSSDRAVLETFFAIAGGSGWTNSDGWRGDGPLEEWYGVSVDSQGRVTALDLSDNGLEGRVPGSLGRLSRMTELRIGGNALAGRLPLSLSSLPSLGEFRYADTDLCVPTEEPFRAWMNAISSHAGTGVDCAPPTDRQILTSLYDATGGPDWNNRNNWLTERPLDEWHGVKADGNGRVTGLDLRNNNLTGQIPVELGSLIRLRVLDLRGNALTGPIMPELGSLAELTSLVLGLNRLAGSIPAELGVLSNLQNLWLYGNKLTGPIPAELGSLANLTNLGLARNELAGAIPPELGSLTKLRNLWLEENALSGSIPPELGDLNNLEFLWLQENGLTGPIPAELGSLANLRSLYLSSNELSGAIPPELGSLTKLRGLWLEENALSGSIPPELGALNNLEVLWLHGNELTGAVPAEFGGLENLRSVVFARNGGMFGALPARLTDLQHLDELLTVDTSLCAPSDAGFQTWLSGVRKRRVAACGARVPPAAYLTQAVQSRDFPVPLVAGKDALLRVFVKSSRRTGSDLPPVRATFYRNEAKRHMVDIPGKLVPIPLEADEGDLTSSVNARIPGWVVQPGLEMVIDIDPHGTLGPNPGVAKRIPERGRLAVEIRTLPVFDLTVIPFLWSRNPDSSIVEAAEGIARDPGGHTMLKQTRTLLPINELNVKAHAPVLSSTNDAHALLAEAELIHAMEGAGGYYMGMMAGEVTGAAGLANRPGRVSFSKDEPWIVAHELGHNLSLYHAPCGDTSGLDPSFPEMDGSIGDWGYDFSEPGRVLPPVWPDLMSYCLPSFQWIGAYHFTNALRYRLHSVGRSEGSALVSGPAKSLLLWGGTGSDGNPFLEPAFVVEAVAAMPQSDGEFEITGRDADGEELFSFSFAMPEVADGDGRSSFVFALPVRPGWDEELASISLSGPGRSVRLDEETDRPVTILRDSGTGEIRGILRGRATGSGDDAVSALALEPGMEVLTSRGIPETEEWSR